MGAQPIQLLAHIGAGGHHGGFLKDPVFQPGPAVREVLDPFGEALANRCGLGVRLDFLTQEFMREANTLCSKAATLALTSAGLDLKAVIEQLREQVQNVE